MRKLLITILGIAGTIFLLLCAYFIFHPLVHLRISSLFVHNLSSYSDAKSYYSILSSFYSMFAATVGIGLGFYYFIRKNKLDDYNKARERGFNRIEEILNQLNIYDSAVDNILALKACNQTELDSFRHTARRSFEIINAILDAETSLLIWSEYEMKSILILNSFVDNSSLIMESNLNQLKTSDDLKSAYQEYLGYLQEARKLCLKKSDKLYV